MLDLQTSDTGVATLTLDRPDVLNALSTPMIDALLDTLARLAADTAVRVLLLTGRGRAFCAGADLRDPMMSVDHPPAERGRRFVEGADARIHALARALARLDKPIVSAINGPAVGGGSSLALLADIVVAGRSAYFQQPFTAQLGLVPDMGGSFQLMHRLGPARAMALAMLGDRLPAQQAADWGLIWQCVDDDLLGSTAMAIAERLAAGAPRALSTLRSVMWAARGNDLDAQLDRERDAQAQLVQTEDFLEAVAAFREKRKPTFGGS
ncbi:acyl-CoA hydratase [Burkholderiales bacterium 8X]|nr:acyl-CoA hydratase [Burkholderiales bacterium 8X]